MSNYWIIALENPLYPTKHIIIVLEKSEDT
jgi:hypothetical protein